MRKVSNNLERLLREQFGDAAGEKHISDEHVALYDKYITRATFLPQEVEALGGFSKTYPFINIDLTLIRTESGKGLPAAGESLGLGESSKATHPFSQVSDIPDFNSAHGIVSSSPNNIASSSSTNDIIVNTASIRFPNAPTTRLADMRYSPVVSPSRPPANYLYPQPQPQPQFQPRDPHNTVLSDDWYTEFINQGTEIPNNEPNEQATNTNNTTNATTAVNTFNTSNTVNNNTINTGANNKRKAGNNEGSTSNKKARTNKG